MKPIPEWYITLPYSVRLRQEEAEELLANPQALEADQPVTGLRRATASPVLEAMRTASNCGKASQTLMAASQTLRQLESALKDYLQGSPTMLASAALARERSSEHYRDLLSASVRYLECRVEARRIESQGGPPAIVALAPSFKEFEILALEAEEFALEVFQLDQDARSLMW